MWRRRNPSLASLKAALFPKQLLPLIGEQSLLQQTAKRLPGDLFKPALIVSGEDQRFFIKRQLEAVGAPVEAILLEPAARNTSAAAALAAAWLHRRHDELMLLMPVRSRDRPTRMPSCRRCEAGIPHAEDGAIVTFGAKPTEPNTQYRLYREPTPKACPDGAPRSRASSKSPMPTDAAEYVRSGRFFWNSGIFLLSAAQLAGRDARIPARRVSTRSPRAIAESTSTGCLSGPMRKLSAGPRTSRSTMASWRRRAAGFVVPVEMEWSDVGAWDAVWKLRALRIGQQRRAGRCRCARHPQFLFAAERRRRLVAAVGLDKMAVIAVRDAVFVAPMDRRRRSQSYR